MNGSSKKRRSGLSWAVGEFLRFCQNGEKRSAALLWTLLCFFIFTISVLLDRGDGALTALNHPMPLWLLYVVALLTLPAGAVCWAYHQNHYSTQKGADSLFGLFMLAGKRRRTFITLSEIFYSAMFVVSLVSVVLFVAYGALEKHLPAITNVGTLFAMITGVGSIIGTLFAVQQILELKHTIVSFTQLQERLIYLLDQAHDSNDSVVFLAYTILPGAFNVRQDLTDKLRTSIVGCIGRIRVVCLKDDAHVKWLDEHFKGKRDSNGEKIDDEYLQQFGRQCSGIINNLKRPRGHPAFFGREWAEMPGFYFFASSQRAMLVAPLKMPRMDVPDTNGAGASLHVEPIGFETTDRKIIGMLLNEFNRYAREDFDSAASHDSTAPVKPSSSPTNVSPFPKAAQPIAEGGD